MLTPRQSVVISLNEWQWQINKLFEKSRSLPLGWSTAREDKVKEKTFKGSWISLNSVCNYLDGKRKSRVISSVNLYKLCWHRLESIREFAGVSFSLNFFISFNFLHPFISSQTPHPPSSHYVCVCKCVCKVRLQAFFLYDFTNELQCSAQKTPFNLLP